MLYEITPDKFDEYINQPCLVDFYTTTCPACVQYAPIFTAAAEHHRDVTFLKINIEQDYNLAAQYSIEYIPTTIKFEGGKPVGGAVGCLTDEQISELVHSK